MQIKAGSIIFLSKSFEGKKINNMYPAIPNMNGPIIIIAMRDSNFFDRFETDRPINPENREIAIHSPVDKNNNGPAKIQTNKKANPTRKKNIN
jgi:hypothetical protein